VTAPDQIVIRTFCLGEWETNCYIVQMHEDTRCWIIDAGFAPEPMIQAIEDDGLQPQQLLLTHAHVDHIAGITALRARWPELPILIHGAEAGFLTDPNLNLSAFLSDPVIAPPATRLLEHGEMLAFGDTAVEVRHPPGHRPRGISLVVDAARSVFAAHALFSGSIGRTDFPTSNHELLMRSITEQLMTLPDDTRVYAGHMAATTIGCERTTNPFL